MDRFQLATLAKWAGPNGVRGRKRLQKIVYFLQRAGCPLKAQYTLHLYGPYSRDLAELCDEMVQAGLLEQRVEPAPAGTQYSYILPEATRVLLEKSEKLHPDRREAIAPFAPSAERLFGCDTGSLELGSTILYFQEQEPDWPAALAGACEFKSLRPDSPEAQTALDLAREFAKLRG